MLKFALYIAFIFIVTVAGAYFALPYVFPDLFNPQVKITTANQIEVLKLLSGLIAGIIASLIAAGTSTLLVRAQLLANQKLEDHKGEIIKELDEKRNSLSKELEDHKNQLVSKLEEKKSELEEQLDKKRQELGFELEIKRARIERTITELDLLSASLNSYRYIISELRHGRFDEDEARARSKDLDLAMMCLSNETQLYRELSSFRQRALVLFERATRINSSQGWKNVWKELSKGHDDNNEPLGVLFAIDGDNASRSISAERARISAGL